MLALPLGTDVPLHARPWATWALLALNVGLFLMRQVASDGMDQALALSVRHPRLTQFFAYAFLHLSWVHLLGNMLALLLLGPNVNDRMGQVGFVAFYLAGAVLAGVAFVLTQPTGAVLGASGAVGAVMGAYLALLPQARLILRGRRSAGTLHMPPGLPVVWPIVIFFLFNLVMSFGGAGSVAYVAHLAGMLFGFVVGLLLARFRLASTAATESN